MIERDGRTWGRPSEVARAVGVNSWNVRDWVRDKLIREDEVRRHGRFLLVDLAAAERAERTTRGRGRPRMVDKRF